MNAVTMISVCAVVVGVPSAALKISSIPPAAALRSGKKVSVSGYRKWVRVNPKPHPVVSHLALLCRSLTPEGEAQAASDPHKDKFVTIYVNRIARNSMLYQKKPAFPEGSVIVKEKLPSADSTSPELLTVMHKREKGYNSSAGDWEYYVLNGSGTKIQSRGRLESCQSCHEQWKETDYVSRLYLTDAMRRRFSAAAPGPSRPERSSN